MINSIYEDNIDIKKIATILNLLSLKVNYLTKLKAVKLLYFIDKEHFLKYGRFITEDKYIKLQMGPIPSKILNIINDPNIYINNKHLLHYLKENIEFSKHKHRTITSKKKPDLEELSKSEIEIIDLIIKKYGQKDVNYLINEIHKEYGWIHGKPHKEITPEHIAYCLNNEKRQELLDYYYGRKEQEREDDFIN